MDIETYKKGKYYRVISQHPCYSEMASHKYGRLHLPVAPKCNIKCNYCNRLYDCVNESRPGVTSKVLTPEEALEVSKNVIASSPHIKVIGIAGPGDPLANEETFETLNLISSQFPDINLCLSTNGLLLQDKINILIKHNLKTLTVTINSIDENILSKIIKYVIYNNEKYTGIEASSLLIKKQPAGIKLAIDAGILVKVNTVLIPNINDSHIVDIAKYLKDIGVYSMNIMPLIPQDEFKNLTKPSFEKIKEVRNICSKYVKQMKHCKQCRADACGYL